MANNDKASDRVAATEAAQPKPEVVAPGKAGDDAVARVKATNQTIEKAGAEAANRLKGQRRERFNITDAVLGADEQHSVNVKKAQAATFGEDYDPKTDPEVNPGTITPAPSQNQNNLKHPDDQVSNDPHAARNYLGQTF
jgi:hypothetical protein